MIEVLDQTVYKFNKKHLLVIKKQTKILLDYLAEKFSKFYKDVNIVLMGEEEISLLNKKYLKKNYPTDVLTFPNLQEKKIISGEVILCPQKILLYSFQDCIQPVNLFYETLLHGLLHLYGMKHNDSAASLKKVHRQQKKILSYFTLNEDAIYGIYEKLIQK